MYRGGVNRCSGWFNRARLPGCAASAWRTLSHILNWLCGPGFETQKSASGFWGLGFARSIQVLGTRVWIMGNPECHDIWAMCIAWPVRRQNHQHVSYHVELSAAMLHTMSSAICISVTRLLISLWLFVLQAESCFGLRQPCQVCSLHLQCIDLQDIDLYPPHNSSHDA